MNKVFNLVWSEARGAWMVTSELALKGAGRPQQLRKTLLSGLIASLLMQATPVMAMDYTGETVASATQDLNDGDTATNTTIDAFGEQNIYSGASATFTWINTGTQNVFSGGVATSTAVNNNGYQRVSSGGVATSTTVNNNGHQVVSAGGMANETLINTSGSQWVDSGGTATNTIVQGFQSVQIIQSGGSATTTSINNGGAQIVAGSATSTTVNMGGRQNINSGGSATSTTVNSGGTQNILAGGSATFTTVNVAGTQSVQGSATSTTINSGGQQSIYSGGSATSTTINTGGEQFVYSGGSAVSTAVVGGGQLVESGGSATSTTVNSSAIQMVYGSATATMLDGGRQIVSAGGSATSTTVNNGGLQGINSGGSATSTTVNSGGEQAIYSGGSATSATINSGGEQGIYFGGSASIIILTSGGTLRVSSANATEITQATGGAIITDTGSTLEGSHSGGVFSISAGHAENMLLENGGYLRVLAGHGAADTTINSGGTLFFTHDGRLTGTTLITGDGHLGTNGNLTNDGSLIYRLPVAGEFDGTLNGSGTLTLDGGHLTLRGSLAQSGVNIQSGGHLVFDALQADVDITAQSGTQLHLTNGSVLTGKVDPLDMTLASGTTWNITGDSRLDNLDNAGDIRFTPVSGSFIPRTLTVTNLSGNGGSITLNSLLEGSESLTDRVVVDGGQVTGNTNLNVVNHGGLGALTSGNGITLVSAINGATTVINAFRMSAPLDVGAFRYTLYRHADESWYLTTNDVDNASDAGDPAGSGGSDGTGSSGGTGSSDGTGSSGGSGGGLTNSKQVNYSNAAWLYTALPAQTMDYDRQLLGDKDSRREKVGESFWMRTGAGNLQHSGGESTPSGDTPESNSDYAFVQLGGDLWQSESQKWVVGLYGAAGQIKGEVHRGDTKEVAGRYKDDVYSVGLYTNAKDTQGRYVDGVVQMSRHNMSAESLTTKGMALATSLEAGWSLQPTTWLSVEPQAQYVWQGLALSDAKDRAGVSFSAQNNNLHQLRVGTRLGNRAANSTGLMPDEVSFWIKPSITQTFGSTGQVTTGISEIEGGMVNFSPRQNGLGAQIETGVETRLKSNLTLGVRAGYAASIKGAVAEGYYGQLNVKVGF